MKKLIGLLIIIGLCMSMYNDLMKVHTIPKFQSELTNTPPNTYKIIVQPGDTVLSIVEAIHQDQVLPSSIPKILEDFQNLNPHADPYDLKVGRVYLFPVYLESLETNKKGP